MQVLSSFSFVTLTHTHTHSLTHTHTHTHTHTPSLTLPPCASSWPVVNSHTRWCKTLLALMWALTTPSLLAWRLTTRMLTKTRQGRPGSCSLRASPFTSSTSVSTTSSARSRSHSTALPTNSLPCLAVAMGLEVRAQPHRPPPFAHGCLFFVFCLVVYWCCLPPNLPRA